MKIKAKILVGMLLLCVLLTACSMANNPVYKNSPAGFGDGIWHGMTAAWVFIWDTFFEVKDPALYASNNVGYWYNCGFFCIAPLIGLVSIGISTGILKSMSEN